MGVFGGPLHAGIVPGPSKIEMEKGQKQSEPRFQPRAISLPLTGWQVAPPKQVGGSENTGDPWAGAKWTSENPQIAPQAQAEGALPVAPSPTGAQRGVEAAAVGPRRGSFAWRVGSKEGGRRRIPFQREAL